ncbi:MAG: COX15/CtaA family protein, partial [Gammaproteobacteria bacterium]
LKPIIVTAHLLGGFTTFSLLFALTLRQSTVMARLTSSQLPGTPVTGTPVSRSLLTMAFLALVLQITLGSWTAANYAATVCTTLPICHGNWIEHLNFTAALKLWGHDVSPYTQGGTSAYEYAQHLSLDTKITIHVLHRFGAVFASTLILLCAGHLWRRSPHLASGLILLLILQVGLGITNVLALLPLSIALLHNLVAALLLGWMLLSVLWTYQQPCLAKHVSLDSRNVQTRPLPTSTHKTTA